MQTKSVWGRACGLTHTVVEGVAFDEAAGAVIVSVRPRAKAREGWECMYDQDMEGGREGPEDGNEGRKAGKGGWKGKNAPLHPVAPT